MHYKTNIILNVTDIEFEAIKEKTVLGRYVNHLHIESFLNSKSNTWPVEIIGSSVEGRNIYSITLGKGPFRVLIWSQMHGNESTTTKAVLDLINTLETDMAIAKLILDKCTIKIVPLLNPDGAWVYKRENARDIDLNRDAQMQSEPESQVLNKIYKKFSPGFCFNLHDQRTIYSAGKEANSATLSFLAPSADPKRSITRSRKTSMRLIASMYRAVQPDLGDHIGRYEDSFNINCSGDMFQSLGTPTVLFEAGHYPGDYQREETRKYVWHGLLTALLTISREEVDQYTIDTYLSIPNNEKLFFDILVRNPDFISSKYEPGQSIGILYKEVLKNHTIDFCAEVDTVGDLDNSFGHIEYDCKDRDEVKKLKSQKNLSALIF